MRNSKKKGLSLVLACVLIAAMLASCTKNDNAKESTSPSASPAASASSSESASVAPEASKDPVDDFEEIKITMLGYVQTGTSRPTEDVLTPIWRAKTKVIPEIVQLPPGMDRTQWLQNQVVGGTLPDILAINGLFNVTQVRSMLIDGNHVREITKDQIIKYMPRTVAYLEELGVTVDQYVQDNLIDGKLWYIPSQNDSYGFDPLAFPNIREVIKEKNPPATEPLQLFIRDDILKKIFPEVRTEKELKELYIKNGGKLSFEEANDIPINNQAELLEFLRKVKALNMKVGNSDVIPAHLNSAGSVDSMLWSNFNLAGYWWTNFIFFVAKDDQYNYAPHTPTWKTYLQFYNTLYNEGLIDKEQFIQKDDQMLAKFINGEYAVYNGWGPVNDARALSEKENRGYGFRKLSTWANNPETLVSPFQDARDQPVSLDASGMGIGINAKITDEELPQILNWIDWNQSKEANELRTWGLPEFSTGTGADRKFKPEYKEIEDWLLYGKTSEKDGNYYGLYLQNNVHAAWNAETYQITGLPYVEGPRAEATLDIDKINIDFEVALINRKHFMDDFIWYRKAGWTESQIDPEGKLGTLNLSNGWESQAGKSAVVKAIIGKPGDFEKNYQAYMDTYSQEWLDAYAEAKANYKTIYDNFIKPEIDKVE